MDDFDAVFGSIPSNPFPKLPITKTQIKAALDRKDVERLRALAVGICRAYIRQYHPDTNHNRSAQSIYTKYQELKSDIDELTDEQLYEHAQKFLKQKQRNEPTVIPEPLNAEMLDSATHLLKLVLAPQSVFAKGFTPQLVHINTRHHLHVESISEHNGQLMSAILYGDPNHFLGKNLLDRLTPSETDEILSQLQEVVGPRRGRNKPGISTTRLFICGTLQDYLAVDLNSGQEVQVPKQFADGLLRDDYSEATVYFSSSTLPGEDPDLFAQVSKHSTSPYFDHTELLDRYCDPSRKLSFRGFVKPALSLEVRNDMKEFLPSGFLQSPAPNVPIRDQSEVISSAAEVRVRAEPNRLATLFTTEPEKDGQLLFVNSDTGEIHLSPTIARVIGLSPELLARRNDMLVNSLTNKISFER